MIAADSRGASANGADQSGQEFHMIDVDVAREHGRLVGASAVSLHPWAPFQGPLKHVVGASN